jgi:hypothetical protein
MGNSKVALEPIGELRREIPEGRTSAWPRLPEPCLMA